MAALLPQMTQAHGEVHALIEALSKRIKASPDSASLYLQRGILYEGHGDFDRAFADFQTVKLKAPTLKVVDLRIASILSDQGHFHTATIFINEFLKESPKNVPGLQMRAMIRSALGENKLALQDRIAALENAKPRGPEFFLDVARAVRKANPLDDSTAISWLERGLAESGFLVSLADYAVSIEVDSRNYAAALSRIEDIILRIPSNPQWMVARAEVLELSGQSLKSQQAYGAALLKIEALPTAKRNTEAMQSLERTVRGVLRLNTQR